MLCTELINEFKGKRLPKGFKRIGRGSKTVAYRLGGKENGSGDVYIRTADPVKECMWCGFMPDSPLLPVIEHVDEWDLNFDASMKYYENTGKKFKVKNLNEESKIIYDGLQTLLRISYASNYEEGLEEFRKKGSSKVTMNVSRLDRFIKALDWFGGSIGVSDDTLNDLYHMTNAIRNYSDSNHAFFEMQQFNLAEDDGQLILLDCFYINCTKG